MLCMHCFQSVTVLLIEQTSEQVVSTRCPRCKLALGNLPLSELGLLDDHDSRAPSTDD